MQNLISLLRKKNYNQFLLEIRNVYNIENNIAIKLLDLLKNDLEDSYNDQRKISSKILYEIAIRIIDFDTAKSYFEVAKNYAITDTVNDEWEIIGNCRKTVYILAEAWENKFELSEEIEKSIAEPLPYNIWDGRNGYAGFESQIEKLKANTKKDEDFEYSVVLSFAGENREYVEKVALELKKLKIKYFYDKDEEVKIWGKDQTEYFDTLYRKEARFCVMFISEYYKKKMWPTHERRSAIYRAISQSKEYVLPVRFDDTDIPGLQPSINYKRVDDFTPKKLAELIYKKIKLL